MYMKLSDMDADLYLCEYIIFFNSFTWFKPSGIDEKLSGMDLEPIFRATDRKGFLSANRQEMSTFPDNVVLSAHS